MNAQTLTFTADEQTLTKTDSMTEFASNTVSYIEATFTLGTNWTGYDAVRAVWKTDYYTISTVLDANYTCVVPTEVLMYKAKVYVNLVGSIASGDTLTDRLTTFPVLALTVTAKAQVEGTETATVTANQFDQYVATVQSAASSITNYTYDSEAWAVGTRGGVAVTSGDDTYQNNSKYWAQEAAAELTDLKAELSQRTDVQTEIGDIVWNNALIDYTGYDTNRSLTSTGKAVTTGSVILSFPVTAGAFIKVSLVNRTGGDILFFFQDTQTVPWDSNTHIIGQIYNGDSYLGYLKVPAGATYLVTNGDMNALVSTVRSVGTRNVMQYQGTLSSGAYTDASVGTYAVSRSNVTGLPSGMSQDYGWLSCYVPNNLYFLVESSSQKTTWLKEGGSDWVQIYPSGTYGNTRLCGKLIAYNGDSICESRFSGFASNGGGYPYLISQIVGGTYENKAVSGGTLAVSSAGHHVCDTISAMSDDADIICIDGGINDYWLDVPLGDYSVSDFTGSVDNTTICGALESIFRQAINKWVGKPIVFVIVHKITTTAWTANGAGYTFAEAREKMIGICEKYSIPYVDMWANGGLNAYMDALNNAYLNGGGNTHPDGCHPDVNGYKRYYVPRLIAMFESLLPYDI